MPRTRGPYPSEFRREAGELVLAGRSVRDVAESLGCSDQSLHNWVKQDQLDHRERDDGLSSAEREELRELRKRVKRVEQERTSSSEPRFSSQRRPRPGERLPDHLGGGPVSQSL
jgi:transposase